MKILEAQIDEAITKAGLNSKRKCVTSPFPRTWITRYTAHPIRDNITVTCRVDDKTWEIVVKGESADKRANEFRIKDLDSSPERIRETIEMAFEDLENLYFRVGTGF